MEQPQPSAPLPAVVVAKVEMLTVTCPYCLIGGADVPVIVRSGMKQVENIRDPRRCRACGRYFKLKPRIVVDSAPLEEHS